VMNAFQPKSMVEKGCGHESESSLWFGWCEAARVLSYPIQFSTWGTDFPEKPFLCRFVVFLTYSYNSIWKRIII
jgi:hypothetical protein